MESQAEKVQVANVAEAQGYHPIVALICERQLLRDCIVRALRRHAADIEFMEFSSIDGTYARLQHVSLVVFFFEWFGNDKLALIERELMATNDQNRIVRPIVFLRRGVSSVLKRAAELGIALVKLESATGEIAAAAIRLALAGCPFAAIDLFQEDETPMHSAPPAVQASLAKTIEDERVAVADGSSSQWITPREMELLERLNRGLQNKVIAHELGISESTVKVHLRNIMRKLNATNRTQVAILMRQRAMASEADGSRSCSVISQ